MIITVIAIAWLLLLTAFVVRQVTRPRARYPHPPARMQPSSFRDAA